MKLQQKEVAEIVGTDEATVYNWEKNRSSPSLHSIPKIMAFLGSVPTNVQPESLGEKIIYYRRLHGLSQEKLARYLRVDPGTLANWEKDKRQPLKIHLEKLEDFLASPNYAKGKPDIEPG